MSDMSSDRLVNAGEIDIALSVKKHKLGALRSLIDLLGSFAHFLGGC